MAIKGLTSPVVGDYNYEKEKNTVSYHSGVVAGSAVEYGASWTTSEESKLYADDKEKESDGGTFQSGELTLGTDDLTPEVSKFILGIKEIEKSYGVNKTAKVIVYDDDMKRAPKGVGIIETHQLDGVPFYRAVVFPKVKFNIPENAATTKGETVEWQTPSITGSIMRSDEVSVNGNHPWQWFSDFESESAALEFLKDVLGVGVQAPLSVTSEQAEG